MENESYKLNLEGDILKQLFAIEKQYGSLLDVVGTLEGEVKEGFDAMKKGAKEVEQSMGVLVADVLGRSVDILSAPLRKGADAVYEYNESLTELKSITGIDGAQLDDLGHMARDMASEFGGTPQGHLDSYTRLLSALTPEIAKNEEAMASFGRTNAMLSNTMKGDAVGAVTALETVMNQYGVSLDDPIEASRKAAEMANYMAAAALAGKVEVPGLTDAMTRSGAEAAAAGVNFMEYAAGIEVAGKFFGSTERLGTAMRGVMSTIGGGVLPEATLEQLFDAGVNMNIVTDKSKPLIERLTELKKIQDDGGLMEKVFGAGETTAGRGLLQNLDLLEKYQTEMRNTPNALEDMNETLMGGFRKQKAIIDNFFSDIRLGMFENFGSALPYLDLIGGGIGDMVQLAPGVMALGQAYGMLANSTRLMGVWQGIASLATWGWTAASTALSAVWAANPIGIAIVGIMALTAGAVYAWDTFEGFRGAIVGLWDAAKTVFGNIATFFSEMFSPIFKAIELFMNKDYAGAGAALTWNFTEGESVGDAYDKGRARGIVMGGDKDADPMGASADGSGGAAAAPMMPNNPIEQKQTAGGGTSRASATGGGGTGKSVTVSIQNLIGNMTFSVTGGKIDEREIKEAVTKALIGAVRNFEVAM